MLGPERTLLVVDDEEDNRELLRRRLEKRGYRVLLARNGEEALATVADKPVDLVLLDVMMPEIDGNEVLRVVRRKHSPLELPIIMVTARSDSQEVVAALAAGANDYVVKPIDFQITLARIENQLQNSQAHAASRAPAAPPQIEPGAVLEDKYRLESAIGSGGFGTVFRARHLHLERDVAIKFLHAHMAAAAEVRTLFAREGISACRVQHPNAVLVLDSGAAGNVPYLVMELLTGRPLTDELASVRPLPLGRAIHIGRVVASVLAEAHEMGIVHRDIKPANVFLHRTSGKEVVKVVDFGIAKLVDDPKGASTSVIVGTPSYMAPERLRGVSGGAGLDVYSLGSLLYEMLTGELPYESPSEDSLDLVDLKMRADAEPPSRLRPGVPATLDDLVARALHPDPEARPSAAEIERLLEGEQRAEPETLVVGAPAPGALDSDEPGRS